MSGESCFYLDIQVFATISQRGSVLLLKMLPAKLVVVQFALFLNISDFQNQEPFCSA